MPGGATSGILGFCTSGILTQVNLNTEIVLYPHYTDRTSQLMLMEIWRRGQTLQAFVALGKLVTPLQAAFVAPDCAGGLDKRTQYRRITLCTLRHRSFYKPLRALHDLTSTTPKLLFRRLEGPPL